MGRKECQTINIGRVDKVPDTIPEGKEAASKGEKDGN